MGKLHDLLIDKVIAEAIANGDTEPKPESTDGRRECWANWDEGACKGESLGFIGPM